MGFLSSRRAERPAGAVDARWRRWVMRDALRRPATLAAASTTGFVSLVVATTVDSSTGGGVSVVADVTLTLAAAVLGGLWFDLPRGEEADVARSIRRLLGLSTVSLIVFAGVYLLAQRSAFGQRFERDVLLGRGAGATGLQGGASAILDQVTAGAVALLAGAVCCVAVVRGRLGLAFATGRRGRVDAGVGGRVEVLVVGAACVVGVRCRGDCAKLSEWACRCGRRVGMRGCGCRSGWLAVACHWRSRSVDGGGRGRRVVRGLASAQ